MPVCWPLVTEASSSERCNNNKVGTNPSVRKKIERSEYNVSETPLISLKKKIQLKRKHLLTEHITK